MIATWRTRDRVGFSLAELLIVIAMIALIGSIVAPVASRGFALARQAQCAGNLRAISQAYGSYAADQAREARDRVVDKQWAMEIIEYFGDSIEPLICPEDMELDWSWPALQMRTDWIGGRNESVFELDPVWLTGDHNDFKPNKPKLWKVNSDVYSAMGSNRSDMPRYTPGNNPKEYWFILEDIGDDDFYDFDMRVREIRPGKVEVTGIHWANAHAWHWIIDPDGKEYRVMGETDPMVFDTPASSYGMNSKAYKVMLGTRKIIFLDYEAIMCYVMSDIGRNDGWQKLKAPRHLGRANVLFATGAVEALAPDVINPQDPSAEMVDFWSPSP